MKKPYDIPLLSLAQSLDFYGPENAVSYIFKSFPFATGSCRLKFTPGSKTRERNRNETNLATGDGNGSIR
ncbi:MAG: hypothetical protein COV67_06330 [Nitrospinae bacterium CG11_big_fil_rev_8_21_14_0_20_56_8]|nr:MAG: hypothetical protein COV67_06330 [Nitrospinae bacterium CG11_big_fil_rev_8_21_14_0_20_56_8]